MANASNELTQAPFVYNFRIRGKFLPSSPIPSFFETGPQIKMTVHKAVKTPKIRNLRSVTVLCTPGDMLIADWHLKSLLLVQLTPARKGSVATAWLEGIAEYGTAENETDAITDLVISLGEYREALERREENLGNSARRELDYLRRLIERSN